ncbi:serine/threonine-protein kinase Nek3 isoform X2 [Hemicordylus capensis]|uniref:serine/threonine-protein kinase Nek3 isoform X2 n=1 Tax=Hemicordylus capensis TaxID=884348 RepID=UPI002303C8D8|nr:serine/threonine-protein kinase Nek3 isoform X2 [Hemicordylus capensis]
MDKYTVLRILGEGSFGRVLLVHHKNRNQKYAMKEIRLPKSVIDTEKSWNESILLAKMKHPNIVTYQESFEADGHLYIVMEYCDDGDLMQKIKLQKGKLFPEDTILTWFAQICLGVKYIHDRRVLHRDIKSKNIFLTQHGKVKLGDFGSALLLTSPMAYACSYVGTPYYVPPEIWENTPYNNKSDIWSLGCILYELCTLKHPFQAYSWKHLILKICKGYYNPLPSHYTYELHYLIKQMFKRNPKNRPSATTILTRNCLSKLVRNFAATEEKGEYARSKTSNLDLGAVSKGFSELGLEKTNVDEIVSSQAVSTSPHRQQWGKGRPSTMINVLENAPLLSSSFSIQEDTSGNVRKYDENIPRKQWTKEPPETLMNMLHNADISLAFKTYTIYKAASDDLLRGPLTEEVKTSDEPDGETITEDRERLEPRSDEEDTDFEAEDDPDWVFELKRTMMESQTAN